MGTEALWIPALIGAAGSIGGSLLGGKAQKEATNNALALQQKGMDTVTALGKDTYGNSMNLLAPFMKGGTEAFDKLGAFTDPNSASSPLNLLLKMISPGADMSSLLEQTPGYQFAFGQGMRGVNNALAARGHGASPGAVAKGAANFTTGLASSTWKDITDRLAQAFQLGTGALQGQVNTGAGAANSGVGAGNALLQALIPSLMGGTNAMSNNITGLGNAQAGMWGSIGNSIQGLGNNASQLAMLQSLMGKGGGSSFGGGSMYASGGGGDPIAMSMGGSPYMMFGA